VTGEAKVPAALTQAVFSVCVDETVVSAATGCLSQGARSALRREFRDLRHGGQRPQFASPLKDAQSCVALIDF